VYAALLMRAVLGVTGFVLILGDKDLPTFHAKHGLVADISWIGSMVVSAHVQTHLRLYLISCYGKVGYMEHIPALHLPS
jgi:hypothetical protein